MRAGAASHVCGGGLAFVAGTFVAGKCGGGLAPMEWSGSARPMERWYVRGSTRARPFGLLRQVCVCVYLTFDGG